MEWGESGVEAKSLNSWEKLGSEIGSGSDRSRSDQIRAGQVYFITSGVS